jgi:CRISPR-associated protein Csx10
MTTLLTVWAQSHASFGGGEALAGSVDAEVLHDAATGLPYVRGRQVKNLLAEECANLLFALSLSDPATHDRWAVVAARMFGSPGSGLGDGGAMKVAPALFPPAVRAAIANDLARRDPLYTADDVLEATTTILRQSALGVDGAPSRNSLRAVRAVLRDTLWQCEVSFADRAPTPDELALLAACARSLRRGGQSRNRGRGRLRVQLQNDEGHLQRFRDSLNANPIADHTPQTPPQNADAAAPGGAQVLAPAAIAPPHHPEAGEEMSAVVFRVRLLEPVLATSLEGDPNSSVSFDFIPGSLLRGALIGRFVARWGDFSAGEGRARELFFNGTTRFLNALPESASGRLLPAPQSWHRKKNEDGRAYDFTQQTAAEIDADAQWKRLPGFYGTVEGAGESTIRTLSPRKRVAVHTRRDRHKGRAIAGSGDVFRYESIDGGQCFLSAILCRAGDAALFLELLGQADLVLGGARSVDYGRARLEDVRVQANWAEVPTRPGNGRTLTLLSEAILRDEWGAFAHDKDSVQFALSKYLGAGVSIREMFWSLRPVGGFNRRAGLPLPQEMAVAAGSVFVLEGGPDAQARRRIESEGIGARRAEGFGRCAFDLGGEEEWAVVPASGAPEPAPEPALEELSEAERVVAGRIAARILDRRLERALPARAASGAGRMRLTNSQLGRLRAVVRDARSQPVPQARDRLRRYLESIESRRATRDAFAASRLQGSKLSEWIRGHLVDEDSTPLASLLDTNDLVTVAGVPPAPGAQSERALVYELHLRLLDAALGRAAKTARGAGGQSE